MTTADLAAPAPSAMANLRDVSWVSDRLTPAMLLRSDAPCAGDFAVDLRAWPPRTVVDLRDPDERGSGQHPLAPVAEVVHVPLIQGSGASLRVLPDSLGALYVSMLDGLAGALLIKAVEAVASRPTPVLVHCAAGKDRTGVVTALVLSLLGVEPTVIVRDYTATAPHMDQVLARLARSNHPTVEHYGEVPPHLLDAPAEAIEAFLAELEHTDGGPRGWFTTAGGSAHTLDQLQHRLLPHLGAVGTSTCQ